MIQLLFRFALLCAVSLPALAQDTTLGDDAQQADIAPVERFTAPRLTRAERLALALPADTELQIFEAGEEHYFALVQLASRADSHGGVLILPDLTSAEAWVEQTREIRRHLADHGWTTLVMEMPPPPLPALPERTLPVRSELSPSPDTAPETVQPPVPTEPATDNGQAVPSVDSATALPPYPERIAQRLSNGLDELRLRQDNRDKPMVILALGSSAGWAADFIRQQPARQRPSLMMIDPRPAAPDQPDLLSSLTQLDSLIIDLYHLPSPGQVSAVPDARQRQQHARREGLTDYHQARISGSFRSWNTPWLSRQIRGKLQRHLLSPLEKETEQSLPAPVEQRPPGRNPTSFDL